MKYLNLKTLSENQKNAIILLWNKEYPVNIHYNSIEEFETYLSKLEDQHHLLVINEKEKIKGWYVDFIRENSRWFAMIIDQEYQGKGIGSELLKRGKSGNEELNGWITSHSEYKRLDGSPYRSPAQFYIKNGFELLNHVKLETARLSAIKIQWKQ